ncbi:MAG: SpoIIE family protein phosphatase [Solirubrobacteraceae bacterium]
MSRRSLSGALALLLCAMIGAPTLANASSEEGHGGLLSIGISVGSGKSGSQTSSSGALQESSKGISVTVSTPVVETKVSTSKGSVEASASTPVAKTEVSTSTGKSTGSSGSETKTPSIEQTSTTTSVTAGSVAKASLGSNQSGGDQSSGSQGAAAPQPSVTPATASSTPASHAASSSASNQAVVPGGTGPTQSGPVAHKPRSTPRRGSSANRSPVHEVTRSGTAATGARPPSAAVNSPSATRRSAVSHHHPSSSDPLSVVGGYIPLGLPVPDWSRPIILILLLLTLGFAARTYITTRRARRLQRAQSTLEGDMQVMQTALVPEVPALFGTLAISTAYRPAEGPAAGGDFYDVFPLPDRRVALILGDVSGHGHQALHQAALTRYTLRAYLEAGLEPGAALALAGEVMSDPHFEHFATVLAGIYDERDSLLTYASAGHPHPLTIGVAGSEVLGGFSSPPLGWGVPTGQRQTVLALCPATHVCFFSDGLVEARTETGLLGREGLRELIEGLEQPSAADLLVAVQQASTTPVGDDMAACVISQRAPAVALAPGRWEELQIDAPLLASDAPRRFLDACGVKGSKQAQTLARIRELLRNASGARLRVRVDRAESPELRAVSANHGSLESNTMGALRATARM